MNNKKQSGKYRLFGDLRHMTVADLRAMLDQYPDNAHIQPFTESSGLGSPLAGDPDFVGNEYFVFEWEEKMTMSELDRWDYNKREVMYNDSPNLAEEGWKTADPIVIFSNIRSLIKENEKLRELLREARDEYDRHPDYDWDIHFAREVGRALDEG